MCTEKEGVLVLYLLELLDGFVLMLHYYVKL
jgi:hypothetical protein